MNSATLKIIFFLIITFDLLLFRMVPNTMNKEVMSLVVVLSLFCVFLFFTRKETNTHLKGQYLKHSSLIIIGLLIVCFQYPIDFILGNVTEGESFIWQDNSIVLKSLVVSSTALVSFFFGYLCYTNRLNTFFYKKNVESEKVKNIFFLECLVILSLVIYFLTVNPLYLIGFYGEEYMGEDAIRSILLFKVFVFSAMVQKSRNQIIQGVKITTIRNYVNYIGWPLSIAVLGYLISVMFSGDRGPIIEFGLLIIASYIVSNKIKISIKKIIIFLFLGSLFITVLGEARNQDKNLTFTEKISKVMFQKDDLSKKSIIPQTQELASSILTIHAAVSYIEKTNNYLFGRFQFQQFAVSIPFSNTIVNDFFIEKDTKYQSSADFITWIIQGQNPTYGNGSSCISDFYLDFGVLGVMFGMLFFGYLIRYAEIALFSNELPSVFAHIFSIAYLCSAIYISRSSVFYGIQFIIWVYFIFLINKYFFNKIVK
jgi:hypothetical protein